MLGFPGCAGTCRAIEVRCRHHRQPGVPGHFVPDWMLIAVHEGAHQKVRALLDQLYVRADRGAVPDGQVHDRGRGWYGARGRHDDAISCDMIVASSDATFGYPEIDAGVPPDPLHALPRIVGKHRAFELLFTGRAFDAQEAQSALGPDLAPTEPGQAHWRRARALAQTLCGKVARGGALGCLHAGQRQRLPPGGGGRDRQFCSVAMTDAARETLPPLSKTQAALVSVSPNTVHLSRL